MSPSSYSSISNDTKAKETSSEESEEEEFEEENSHKQDNDEDGKLSEGKREERMEVENFQNQNREEQMQDTIETFLETTTKMLDDMRAYSEKLIKEWEEIVQVVKKAADEQLYWSQLDANINLLPWTEADRNCKDKERMKQRAFEFRVMSACLQFIQRYLNACADALEATV